MDCQVERSRSPGAGSTKIGHFDCGVSCEDFSFVEMTKKTKGLEKREAVALIEAASFCAGFRRKRYSG